MRLNIRLHDENDSELIALIEGYDGGKTEAVKAGLRALMEVQDGSLVERGQSNGNNGDIVAALNDITRALSSLHITTSGNGGTSGEDHDAAVEEMKDKFRSLGQ